MELKTFIRKANYYETDQMGVIHHANYIRWFEEARVDFMEQIGFGYDKAVQSGIDFAVLEAVCRYHSMVRFGETVSIALSLSELKSMSMTVNYEVRDARTGELRASGQTRHCFYDGARKRPVSLKKALPELYALFESLAEQTESFDKAQAAPHKM